MQRKIDGRRMDGGWIDEGTMDSGEVKCYFWLEELQKASSNSYLLGEKIDGVLSSI